MKTEYSEVVLEVCWGASGFLQHQTRSGKRKGRRTAETWRKQSGNNGNETGTETRIEGNKNSLREMYRGREILEAEEKQGQ